MTTSPQRAFAARQAVERKAHPYIYAWGNELGSYDAYVLDQAELATFDGAPADVIYVKKLDPRTGTRPEEIDDAIACETAGTAHVVRNDSGTPIRVWYRMTDQTPGSIRERVTQYANSL